MSIIIAEDTIIINEINYNSADSLSPKDWVELYNITTDSIDIGNWIFKDDNEEHEFIIPVDQILPPDGYIVICDSLNAFHISFPYIANAIGDFDFKLRNDGELIRLFDDEGELIDSVRFNDVEPWPVEADGDGPTLELINPYIDNASPSNWAASIDSLGTPSEQNSNYIDCFGVLGGSAMIDGCGVCDGDNSSCTGCMEEAACNYNSSATISGDCEYPVENYDCNGNCNVEVDCDGICGGSLVDDGCGVCDGDNSSCTGCMEEVACNYNSSATISGDCEYSEINYDCNGNCNVAVDCSGVCGGSAVDDGCGVCDGDNSSCTGCIEEAACNYNSSATISGDCEYPVENYDCNGNCLVEVDCDGICGGSAIEDVCGICGGGILEVENCVECPESEPEDCFGVCGGGAVDDDCGVCNGGNTSCTGCMEEVACNYNSSAIISGGCEYSEVNYDCSGNCNVEVDCSGVCGGSAVDDECGVCDGDNSTCTGCTDDTACNYNSSATISGVCEYLEVNYDCNGNCNVAVDCSGVCGGSAVDDGCGVCDGDNSSCTGCIEEAACNYNSSATISGDCEYPVENYDCNGNCLVEVDCDGICGGSAAFDCAGVCNGDAEEDICGICNGNATDTNECELSTDSTIPNQFGINSIYPNPFNPVVDIDYSLSKSDIVNIRIYDLSGQIVEQLFLGHQSIGNYQITWNADNYPSGVYFVRLVAGDYIATQKLMLMK